jgi:hypothetical protein
VQQIHNGTNQTLTLDIYKNGYLSNADGSVFVTITDADTSASVTSGSAFNAPPNGRYTFDLYPNFTSLNKVLKVKWDYVINSASTFQTQYVQIVTPYALVSDIVDYYNIGPRPSDLNYHSERDITTSEQIARLMVENYTGQKFGTRYDFQEQFGSGSDALELTERMLTIDKVYENGKLVIDYTTGYNVFGYDVELTPTGKAIRIKLENSYGDVRYDNQVDPTILYYGSFRNHTRYKVVGQFGYNYVPQDIKLCTMLLCGDLLSNDAAWRTKYLNKINLAEVSFELAKGAFNGTGNVIVDSILDGYRNINMVVI